MEISLHVSYKMVYSISNRMKDSIRAQHY